MLKRPIGKKRRVDVTKKWGPWWAAERASGLTLDPKVPGSNPGLAAKNDGLMQRAWWNARLAN